MEVLHGYIAISHLKIKFTGIYLSTSFLLLGMLGKAMNINKV